MDAARLKEKIISQNTTIEAVAEAANMDRSNFYRKLKNNGKGFTVEEVKLLAKALNMNPAESTDIFFAP